MSLADSVKLLLARIGNDHDEPVVVFNFKDDYTDWVGDHAASDVVRVTVRDSTECWNIFREVTTGAEFEQLGKTLFEEHERSARNPFFPRAARQLFVAVLKTVLSPSGSRWPIPRGGVLVLDYPTAEGDRETQQALTTRERTRDGEKQTMGGRGR